MTELNLTPDLFTVGKSEIKGNDARTAQKQVPFSFNVLIQSNSLHSNLVVPGGVFGLQMMWKEVVQRRPTFCVGVWNERPQRIQVFL